MAEISEQDLVNKVTITDRIPKVRRGRTTNNPWAPTVDRLIEHYQDGVKETAELEMPNATPGEIRIVEKTINRIRSLGQADSRKHVSIRVVQEPHDNGTVTICVYITDKVSAGRPSKADA